MKSLSVDKQADIIDALSRQLADILNINIYFDNMVSQIYPSELQLNRANTADTKASFLDLQLSFSNDIVLPKFTTNVAILIMKLSEMVLTLHPKQFIFSTRTIC